MKRNLFLTTLLAVAVLGTVPAEAAKGNRKAKRQEQVAARILGRFDRDKSGSLDAKEAERARRVIAAVRALDTDNNGEFSDSELNAVKPVNRGEARKNKGGKKKDKKAAA